ncbi:hypothetical protein E2C01_021411 [Portunus trituberculatus]|uniref:Uncharacterized protein n=1 Tax=Portunus trituberculatus TaxID=210409 RepID=A0A5B7E4B7_PORTR|nr:hypothetical protein [Portunus trituberculatus]
MCRLACWESNRRGGRKCLGMAFPPRPPLMPGVPLSTMMGAPFTLTNSKVTHSLAKAIIHPYSDVCVGGWEGGRQGYMGLIQVSVDRCCSAVLGPPHTCLLVLGGGREQGVTIPCSPVFPCIVLACCCLEVLCVSE